jgi:DNA-binding ferritin-like protein
VDPYQTSIEVVWHDPTSYDPVKHAPPYMPVRLASEKRARVQTIVASQVAPRVAQSFTSGVAPLSSLLVILRAAAFIHQTHHWQTRGSQAYADHLLFERLYNDSQSFIDQVAERAVGLAAPDLVDPIDQSQKMAGLIEALTRGSGSMVATSLRTESVVLSVIAQALKTLEANGALTSGTSNLLEGAADLHETFVYLLSQRNATEAYDYAR